MKRISALLTGLVFAFTSAAVVAAGGPVVLAGIDPADGGAGSHGPIGNWESLTIAQDAGTSNGGTGLLVIGGGKAGGDDVTVFWNLISTDTGLAVTFVNGAGNIAAQSFTGFTVLVVVGSDSETPSGGLTTLENDALIARSADIATFVNGGGALLGFTQTGFANPYAYFVGLGAVISTTGQSISNITPTAQGLLVGITDALDICCWHDTYPTFPASLDILANDPLTSLPTAIGGVQVVLGPPPAAIPVATLSTYGLALLFSAIVFIGLVSLRYRG